MEPRRRQENGGQIRGPWAGAISTSTPSVEDKASVRGAGDRWTHAQVERGRRQISRQCARVTTLVPHLEGPRGQHA